MKIIDMLNYDNELLSRLAQHSFGDEEDIKVDLENAFALECGGFFTSAKEYAFFSYINIFEGKIVERIFACRYYYHKFQCEEVIRRIEGVKNSIHRKCYFTCAMNFYYVGKRCIGAFNEIIYGNKIYDDWVLTESMYSLIDFNRTLMFKKEDLFILDSSLRYCGITDEELYKVIMYISVYRLHPCVEMLNKLGILKYIHQVNLVKRLEKDDKKFRKYLFKYKNELKRYSLSYNDVLFGFKFGVNPGFAGEYRNYRTVFNEFDIKPGELASYLNKEDITVTDFFDNLNMLKKIYPNPYKKSLIYPKNFHDIHLENIDKLEVVNNSDCFKKFKKVRTKALKKTFEDENYILLVPECKSDFISEGINNHNCVGRCGYYEKMSRGSSYIYFLRKKEDVKKSFITIEYNPKMNKVIQCYLRENKKPDDILTEYVNRRLCGC